MASLYYFFIHGNLSHRNTAWCSTSITKLRKIASKQKQALRAIPFPTPESNSKSIQVMKEFCILNIYQLNTYNALHVMFNIKE